MKKYLYIVTLLAVVACSGDKKVYRASGSAESTKDKKVGADADEESEDDSARTFSILAAGKAQDELTNIVAIHQVKEDKFALMKKDGKSFVFDTATSDVTAVEGGPKISDATSTFALPDTHVWYLTAKSVGRSVDDLKASPVKLLTLPLELPAEGPVVLGVGEAWIALFWADNAYIITCDGKALLGQKIAMPESLFGGDAPEAGGLSSDKTTVWFWGSNNLYALVNKKWVKNELAFELKDSDTAKAAAFDPQLVDGKPTVPGNIMVLAEHGILFSEGESGGGPTTSSLALTWEKDVKPLNDKYCIACHAVGSKSGDYSTEKTWLDGKAGIVATVKIEMKGKTGVMPPSDGITDDERTTMVTFLNQPPPTAALALTWDKDIKPLNDKYCIMCHGPTAAAGDYSTEAKWVADKANVISRVEVAKKGKTGEMPTPAGAITDGERTNMVTFLNAPAPSASISPSPTPSASPSASPTPTPTPSPSPTNDPALILRLNTDGNASCGRGNNACHASYTAAMDFTAWVKLVATRKATTLDRLMRGTNAPGTAGQMPPTRANLPDATRARMIIDLGTFK